MSAPMESQEEARRNESRAQDQNQPVHFKGKLLYPVSYADTGLVRLHNRRGGKDITDRLDREAFSATADELRGLDRLKYPAFGELCADGTVDVHAWQVLDEQVLVVGGDGTHAQTGYEAGVAQVRPYSPSNFGVSLVGMHKGDVQLPPIDCIAQFRDAIRAAGLTPPEEINADGQLHRFSSNGKSGDDAGYYVLHLDGIPAGLFGDWRSSKTEKWRANIGRDLTPEEHSAQQKRADAMRRKRGAEKVRKEAEAARKARSLWEASKPAGVDHPYLMRKGVSPVAKLRELHVDEATGIIGYLPKSSGEALTGRLLVAPVHVSGQLTTVEMIDEVGRKSALAGGMKAGGYWAAQAFPAGDNSNFVILIGEGVATALSAREATGHRAIAALSGGQLESVARALRNLYPAARLVILADLTKDIGGPDPRAIAASRAVGGLLVVPDFGSSRLHEDTDFNDMVRLRGKEAVRRIIAEALASTLSDGVPEAPDVDVTSVTHVRSDVLAALDVTSGSDDNVAQVTSSPIPGPDERPRFVVLNEWIEDGGRKFRPGVWYFGIKAGKANEPPSLVDAWICTPLHIEAVTFDGREGNFGRLLRFKNTLGRWCEWAMPMELLRASGDDLRGELLAMGVQIDPSSHRLLGQYLQSLTPKRRMRCALTVGWSGASYVLPDEVIGTDASDVIFQSGERGHDEHTRGGTLKGWQDGIAARAVGNQLLMLAVSASFAGPLLAKCNAEGGGIHFVGDSATGKTTLLEAACATWGGPTYRRSWRATANGMEGAAALFNDCLLALDEISEADPREVGAIVYALGNGVGKQRAGRSGSARNVARWKCVIVSSGERTVATTMADGGSRAKAGQEVRMLDIPAVRTFGAWDTLHGYQNGAALSDALKRAAAEHHGHAGRVFLHKLTRDSGDMAVRLERLKALPAFAAEGCEGQERRAAARFALFALAGELATEFGVTGWLECDAIDAAGSAFKAWRASRGRGNDERRQISNAVADFIERHGDSRFSSVKPEFQHDRTVNRSGWWRDGPDGRVYLFTAAGLREALSGFDFKRALASLQEIGALPASNGERSKPERIGGRLVRVYQISTDNLRGADVD